MRPDRTAQKSNEILTMLVPHTVRVDRSIAGGRRPSWHSRAYTRTLWPWSKARGRLTPREIALTVVPMCSWAGSRIRQERNWAWRWTRVRTLMMPGRSGGPRV
jgi:hypothetical protein